jgi:hypothetical protein
MTRIGTVLVQVPVHPLPVQGTVTVSTWRYSTVQTFVGKNNSEYRTCTLHTVLAQLL